MKLYFDPVRTRIFRIRAITISYFQKKLIQIRTKNSSNKVGIFIVAHRRSKYIIKNLEGLLSSVDSDLYEVCILKDEFVKESTLNEIKKECHKHNVTFRVFSSHYYFDKVKLIASSSYKIVIKCDEDLYFGKNSWLSIFASLKSMDSYNFDVLSPILSTGIPSVELFLDKHPDSKFVSGIRNGFAKTNFTDWWGGRVQYENLNGKYDARNSDTFFQHVDLLPHVRKGIHPIRLNEELQRAMMLNSLGNQWWNNLPVSSFVVNGERYPYFCNSFYITKRTFLVDLLQGIESGDLENDGYDEIALNQHLKLHNRRIGFISHAIGIHPSYNTIGDSYLEIADIFFHEI